MDNEIIQLFFDPATEYIDWEKRKPRISQQITKTPKEDHSIKQAVPQNKLSVSSEMTEDFSNFIADVNLKVNEYRKARVKELLIQLEDDYKILCVNFEHFGRPQVMLTCIKNVRDILRGNTKKLEKIKKQVKQKRIGMTDKGIHMQERLSEIKSLIKKDLSQNELREINNELIIYKNELTENSSVFSKADNIQIKLSLIENYLYKLSPKINTSSILPEKREIIAQNTPDKTQNGQTQRGIEIQEELASLREEVKRKDLNPIEKENLTNNLLKLKKEITLEMEKFSKFDSIPIRLNQIENYLKKLKEQEEKKSKTIVSIQNKNQETINEKILKKEKKRVIWKFGL